MRICMVVPAFMEFGGLEKIACHMALALRAAGHQASVLTIAPVPADNQYARLLRAHRIPLVQPPAWLWALATDWSAKEKLVARLVGLATPGLVAVALALALLGRRSWRRAWRSTRGWLSGRLMDRLGPSAASRVREWLLGAWLRWWRYDLLHLHGYTDSLAFVLDWAARRGVPAVYAENQTPDAGFDWWGRLGASINQARVVLAASDISAQALRTVCGVRRPIATFLPIVPDPRLEVAARANGQHAADASAALDNAEHADAPVRVTTVARLYVTKGLTYLLEAIAKVRAAHPGTRFTVYGDGPLRADLLDYAARLGLSGPDIFVGTFTGDELPAVMAATDVFVSSSVLEGLPLAIVEAMAFGRAIVATDAGGVREIIQDGVTGCLCPTRDADCLARQILGLIEQPARRAALGQAARLAYEQGGFHPAAVASRLAGIYQQALSETGGEQ